MAQGLPVQGDKCKVCAAKGAKPETYVVFVAHNLISLARLAEPERRAEAGIKQVERDLANLGT